MLSHEGLPSERESLEYAWQMEILLGKVSARVTTIQVRRLFFSRTASLIDRSFLDRETVEFREEFLPTNYRRGVRTDASIARQPDGTDRTAQIQRPTIQLGRGRLERHRNGHRYQHAGKTVLFCPCSSLSDRPNRSHLSASACAICTARSRTRTSL